MTPTLSLSKQEALRSIRDAVVVGLGSLLGALLPQVTDILLRTNFGEYSPLIAVILGLLSPILNRYLNIYRIQAK